MDIKQLFTETLAHVIKRNLFVLLVDIITVPILQVDVTRMQNIFFIF